MISLRIFLWSVLMGLGLSCSGGGESSKPPPPPPPPPSEFRLEISPSGALSYAGEKPFHVEAIRGIESKEPVYWTVEGLGYMAVEIEGKQPIGATNGEWRGGYYIPPMVISGGGDTTAKVSYTTKDLYNNVMKKSPELIVQLRTLKEPMKFEVWGGTERTLNPSGKVEDLGARVFPIPFTFDPRTSVTWKITGVAPEGQDIGSLALTSIQNDERGSWAAYTAPGAVTKDFDVTITATTHDPWFNWDPVLTWTVHVKKP